MNAFNLIRIDRPRIQVESLTWNNTSGAFTVTGTARFQQTLGGWIPDPANDSADQR